MKALRLPRSPKVLLGMAILVVTSCLLTAAAWRLALGLTVMFTLAPATRWGYFVYPIGLIGWMVLTRPPADAASSSDSASSSSSDSGSGHDGRVGVPAQAGNQSLTATAR